MTGSLLAVFKRNTVGVVGLFAETMARFLRLRKETAVDIADRIRHGVTTRIEACTTCGTELPLRIPGSGEPGINWQCTVCGYRYYGVLDENCPEDVLKNVRKADGPPQQTRRRRGAKIPATRGRLGRPIESKSPNEEVEDVPRHTLDSTILARYLDENQETAGEAFLIQTQNISSTGIALRHSAPIQPGRFLRVELLDAKCHVVKATVRVLRCSQADGFFEIAGAFLEPIEL